MTSANKGLEQVNAQSEARYGQLLAPFLECLGRRGAKEQRRAA